LGFGFGSTQQGALSTAPSTRCILCFGVWGSGISNPLFHPQYGKKRPFSKHKKLSSLKNPLFVQKAPLFLKKRSVFLQKVEYDCVSHQVNPAGRAQHGPQHPLHPLLWGVRFRDFKPAFPQKAGDIRLFSKKTRFFSRFFFCPKSSAVCPKRVERRCRPSGRPSRARSSQPPAPAASSASGFAVEGLNPLFPPKMGKSLILQKNESSEKNLLVQKAASFLQKASFPPPKAALFLSKFS